MAERLAKAIGWDGAGGEAGALKVLLGAPAEDIIKHQDLLLTANVSLIRRMERSLEALVNALIFTLGIRKQDHVRVWARHRTLRDRADLHTEEPARNVP